MHRLKLLAFAICFSGISTFTGAKTVNINYEKSLYDANQGDVDAQYNLGVMYYKGDGVPQNFKQAFIWYQKAASQGDATAQYNLGEMYYEGKGVRQNYRKSFLWYERSAKQNHAQSLSSLGIMYATGTGTAQDKVVAKELFGRSCDNGYQKGCDYFRQMNK